MIRTFGLFQELSAKKKSNKLRQTCQKAVCLNELPVDFFVVAQSIFH